MDPRLSFPELFYPVRKVRADELVPGILTNSYNSHKIVADTPQGLKELNSCSDIYHLLTNEEIIMPIWDTLNQYYPMELKAQVYQDSVFKYDFIIKNPESMGEYLVKDMVFPTLSIDNSYNGKKKLTATLSIMRLVCTNGMMVPETLFPGEKFMHTPAIGEGLALDTVMKMVEHFLEEIPHFLEPFNDLRTIPVRGITARVDEVIEATKFPVGQRDAVIDRIHREMNEYGLPKTDWLIYNGFNFNLNHNQEIELPPYRKSAMDSEIQLFLLEN